MGDKLIMSKKELRRKSILDLVQIGQLSLKDASQRLDVSYRQIRRINQRYSKEGDTGLIHKNRGKVSPRKLPLEMKQNVLALYQEKYWDFGPTLASEKLLEEDGYQLHAETLRLWLKEAGLWQNHRQRKAHRKRRNRRDRFGELLQLDGSIHAWITGIDVKQCLMNLVDDATGKTLSLMDIGETTAGAFRLLNGWIKLHGIPMAIYVDLKSLYVSPKALQAEEGWTEPEWLTHFSSACKELGIEIIKAYSPQAKGRVERSHGVYQDRLVKEIRLKKIQTIEEVNHLLRSGFVDALNKKFMKTPHCLEDAHITLLPDQRLDDILCWKYSRIVSNDFVIRFENQLFQIDKCYGQAIRPKQTITLKRHLNGRISLWSKGQKIGYHTIEQREEKALEKQGHDRWQRSIISQRNKNKSPWSQFNPGWLKRTQDHLVESI